MDWIWGGKYLYLSLLLQNDNDTEDRNDSARRYETHLIEQSKNDPNLEDQSNQPIPDQFDASIFY